MLRLLLNIFIIMMVVRLFQPLIRKVGGKSKPKNRPEGKKRNPKNRDADYSEYTPYEIEDADYEEVGSDRK